MRIGQIVFINNQTLIDAQTGIIVRKEFEHALQEWWYEVLCNDGQNHVLPEQLLSPAQARVQRDFQKHTEIKQKIVQGCIKYTHNQLNYIHNQSQNNNLIFTHK